MTSLTINGKKFDLFELDTKQTVINRIAYYMKTSSKYLCFPFGEWDLNTKQDIIVKNIIDVVKGEGDLNFSRFWNKIQKSDCMYKDPIKDILIPYIIFNPVLKDVDNFMSSVYLLSIQTDLSNYPEFQNITVDDLENMLRDSEKMMREIYSGINKFQTEQKTVIENMTKFEKMKDIPFTSSFQVEKYTSFITMKIDQSLEYIFDNISVSNNLPLVVLKNNFVKMLKGWNVDGDDTVFTQRNVDIYMLMKLEDGNILVDFQQKRDGEFIVSWITENKKEQHKNIVKIIEQCFKMEYKLSNTVSKKNISGVFYISNSSIVNTVLLDMITNDEFWCKIFWINELDKAAGTKRDTFIYKGRDDEKISLVITSNIVEKYDAVTKIGEKDKFKEGSPYIRIKIVSSPDYKGVENMKEIIPKLISIYKTQSSKILKFYNNYIKADIVEDKPKSTPKKQRLKDIEPKLFAPGYPSKCQNPPRVIEESERDEIEKKGFQVIKFPLKETSGIKPRLYSCDQNEKYIYPGLRKNTLENKKDIDVLPCCYLYDHEKKKGSLYRHYYYDEPILKQTQQDNVITTDKILSENNNGLLPDTILSILGKNWIRMGAAGKNKKDSLLDCCNKILNKNFTRKSLAEKPLLNKQECYDFDEEDIKKMINGEQYYLNPRLVYNGITQLTQCNIIIFSRIGKTSEIKFLRPRAEPYYIYPDKKDRTIILYEHMGSRYDTVSHPVCEIIAKIHSDGSSKKLFTHEETKSILSFMYSNDKSTWSSGHLSDFKFDIVGQGFDSYGKTRILDIQTSLGKTLLFTTPLCPNDTKIYNPRHILDLETVKKITSLMKIKDTVINNTEYVITGKFEKMNVAIPFKGYKFNKQKTNITVVWNMERKLTEVLKNHTFYLYSIDKPNDINEWLTKRFIIEKDWQYKNMNNKLSIDTTSIMKNGKIVLHNKYMLDKLKYILLVNLKWNNEFVVNFKNLKFIPNFYKNVEDFKSSMKYVVVEGINNALEYVRNSNIENIIYSEPKPLLKDEYMFKNKFIGKDVFIAKNSKKLSNNENYVLYAWNNNVDEIKKYIVKNNPTNTYISVIGYKSNGKALYTVLK